MPTAATPSIVPWLQNAIDQFDKDGFKHGDTLSHDWIRWALEIPAPSTVAAANEAQFVLLHRFDAFREYLLVNRKIALQSVRGKGYWVVPPDEQAKVAAEEAMKLIRRGLATGTKILEHADHSKMSATASTRHTNVQVKMSGLKAMVNRQKRDVFATFKPAKTIGLVPAK